MHCPICPNERAPHFYEGIEVDACDEHGVWLDRGELTKIIAIRDERFPEAWTARILAACGPGIPAHEPSREVSCVTCSEPMPPINYHYSSGIIINRCPQGHGLWLDHDELAAVQAYLEHWEREVEAKGDEYASMLEEVRREHEARERDARESGGVSSLGFINALLRRIVELLP